MLCGCVSPLCAFQANAVSFLDLATVRFFRFLMPILHQPFSVCLIACALAGESVELDEISGQLHELMELSGSGSWLQCVVGPV